jgi:hypothetical protein
MKDKRKPNKQVKIPFYKTQNYYYLIGGFSLLFLIYIFSRMIKSDRNLLSLNLIPLILGIIFENRRLSTDWKIILLKLVKAIPWSFLAFIPYQTPYNFENNIEIWPFVFLLSFVVISISYYEELAMVKLTEGVTFLQAISLLYWVFDEIFHNHKSIAPITLIFAIFMFSYSTFHAFTHYSLNRKTRLNLSVSTSVIIFIFAIDHLIRVYKNTQTQSVSIFLNFLQYFLLGVSSLYIIMNILTLLGYIARLSNKRSALRELDRLHIDRYSSKQVSVSDALVCLLFCGTVYYLNFSYRFIPAHTAIWLSIILFPYFLTFFHKIGNANRQR